MVRYTAGTTKGATKQGDVFNDPSRLGKVDTEYTSEKVTETASAAGAYTVAWTPVLKESFEDATGTKWDVKLVRTDGTIEYANVADVKTGVISGKTVNVGDRIAYRYNNELIPQKDLPILNAEMANIPLMAKARRIAIYYSQMAQFQAKTDYGFDLGEQLSSKAVGQLQYEVDTEVVKLLTDNAAEESSLNFSKTLPVGVNMRDHYASFTEKIENGRALIYSKTKRFAPNYMIIAANVLPILTFIDGFKAANVNNVNGPYLCGNLNGLKVYVSPELDKEYVLGVNGSDFATSAAVYAPYMPIVPTQLLGYADGGMSQGFSTLYDLKLLNKDLLCKGTILD